MSTLVSCTSCERFVRSSDSECPFCGVGRDAQVMTLKRPNMARAAIVALALAGGCSSAAIYGGPPPESEPRPESEADSTEDTEEIGEPDEPDESETEQAPEPDIEQDVPRPAYGAAPPASE